MQSPFPSNPPPPFSLSAIPFLFNRARDLIIYPHFKYITTYLSWFCIYTVIILLLCSKHTCRWNSEYIRIYFILYSGNMSYFLPSVIDLDRMRLFLQSHFFPFSYRDLRIYLRMGTRVSPTGQYILFLNAVLFFSFCIRIWKI